MTRSLQMSYSMASDLSTLEGCGLVTDLAAERHDCEGGRKGTPDNSIRRTVAECIIRRDGFADTERPSVIAWIVCEIPKEKRVRQRSRFAKRDDWN